MDVRTTVDPDLCIGSGDCVALVPDAFHIDEAQGVSVVRAGAAEVPVERLVAAARGCPTQAIRVTQGAVVLHESQG